MQRAARALRRCIPIIADTYVDREFGTGALKITPGHDPNDYEIGRRVGLPMLNIMNDDGTLNATAGSYAGLDRFVARERIWADIEVGLGAHTALQDTATLVIECLQKVCLKRAKSTHAMLCTYRCFPTRCSAAQLG